MATHQLLFDNGFMSIEYNEETHCLYHVWKDFIRTEDYKATLLLLQQYVQDLKPHRLLVDQRKRKVLAREASEWFIKEWFPKFATGLTFNIKVAFVDAEDIFGKATAHNNISQLEKLYKTPEKLSYRYFSDISTAENWLDN
jgi:hypothetical protein